MTQTLACADIRGYYAALGIQIPGWARTEASIRCFAGADAHQRGDRDPSCSVNLEHGAWHCHACGASGGAFDAATKRGYSDRQAIDLMVAYGLTEYRTYRSTTIPMRRASTPTRQASAKPTRLSASITEDAIATWRDALTRRPELIARLTGDRGWLYSTMLELGLGFDRARITIPVRDYQSQLIGMLRYQPWPNPGEPKMLATAGSRRALLPHPAAEPSTRVLLVEGEPDMIAARSHGLRAIATPGADSWRTSWAQLLSDRQVTIIMDCDEQGRLAAATIANDLSRVSDVHVLDLAPDRNDGYDLTDRLLEGWEPQVLWR